ncbi:MAG: NAD-dependent DNA ligase LigA [Acholeplasmatales bacterium]|jgi:DNA ligase (NAD+)|nr:NAD-dependent DNA ligase LigA [Acholeplasmatales bacterium]
MENKETIKNQIQALRDKINQANYEYHTLDNPTFSDYEYDQMMQNLLDLETQYPQFNDPNSPTQKIGGTVLEEFQKVVHESPMMSLGDVFNIEELNDFFLRVQKEVRDFSVVSELKIDGLAINLFYQDGILVQASTRGDGTTGEDVTANVKTIKNIPLVLPQKINLKVRGEVYLPLKSFFALNNERREKGESLFANPRNAAAGTIRQLDSKVVSQRNLASFIYTLVNYEDFALKTQKEVLEFLAKLGFSVNPYYRYFSDLTQLPDLIAYYQKIRDEVPYDTDGVVLKVNEFKLYDDIGYTAKAPKWAIAYKFPPQAVETKLLDIIYQVGRTGVITPVAVLERVNVSGSFVSRASLHNEDYIIAKDIRIGDVVLVHKAAEIIPEVLMVNKSKRSNNLKEFSMIKNCPVCGSQLVKINDGVDYFCLNEDCKGKNINGIVHFASRNAMDIDSLGVAVIEDLHEVGILNNILDIYKLKNQIDVMNGLFGFGEKKIKKLLASIEISKNRELSKLIFGLGIKHVGQKYAKILAKHYTNLAQLREVKLDYLQSINDFGQQVSQSIYTYFHNEKNVSLINELISLGINPQSTNQEVDNDYFVNKKIVITGTFVHYSRSELTLILENMKAKVSSSISKATDLLICGKEAGSKLEKAEKLGIKIILEEELEGLLNG